MRKWIPVAVKALLSGLFIVILVSIMDLSRTWSTFKRLSATPELWLIALPAQIVVVFLQGWSWRILFSVRRPMGWNRCLSGTLIVSFAGTFTPGRFSARLSAPFVFHTLARNHTLSFCTSVTYIQTVCYLIVYGIASGFGILYLLTSVPFSSGFLLILPVGLYLVTGLGLLRIANTKIGRQKKADNQPPRKPWYLAWVPKGWINTVNQQSKNLDRLLANPLNLALTGTVLFLSITLFPGLRLFALFQGLDLTFSPWVLMFLVPAAYSVTILPVSLGGIGIAEGTAVGIFALLGVDISLVLPAVLVDRLLAVYLPALLGWILFTMNPIFQSETNTAPCSKE